MNVEIEMLVRRRSTAVVAGDMETLKQILSENFIYIDASGNRLDRVSYLENYVASNSIKWISQEVEEVSIRDYEDTSIVMCRVHDKFILAGKEFDTRLRATFVYAKQNEIWRCVFGQSTRIAV